MEIAEGGGELGAGAGAWVPLALAGGREGQRWDPPHLQVLVGLAQG